MGKKKQSAVLEEKKEYFKKAATVKKGLKTQKYFKKNSLLIIITIVLFIIDFLSVATLNFSFSNLIIGTNPSNLEYFGPGEFWIFTKILFFGIINGFILILITILLRRFQNKE
ncbi:hypothetical protein [uncultured Kordia sp.]|uniref:hypothetical protein n=1 Tax=uncultured Kordia sp. TaxID=507699 RepID=UPI00262B79C2|nr:hypothetical protein [uncultured Kordia sp.]